MQLVVLYLKHNGSRNVSQLLHVDDVGLYLTNYQHLVCILTVRLKRFANDNCLQCPVDCYICCFVHPLTVLEIFANSIVVDDDSALFPWKRSRVGFRWHGRWHFTREFGCRKFSYKKDACMWG
jgi:hypothetical protein